MVAAYVSILLALGNVNVRGDLSDCVCIINCSLLNVREKAELIAMRLLGKTMPVPLGYLRSGMEIEEVEAIIGRPWCMHGTGCWITAYYFIRGSEFTLSFADWKLKYP